MAKREKVGSSLRNINLETPLVKHATESPNAYKMFMDFVQSDGLLTMATIAEKYDASLSYVERMCSTQKWRQRRHDGVRFFDFWRKGTRLLIIIDKEFAK